MKKPIKGKCYQEIIDKKLLSTYANKNRLENLLLDGEGKI